MTFIPTDAPPSAPARKVGEHKPDLLLTQEHHLCPGCGEPLALRILLETIQELGVADRTIARARHRLLHELLEHHRRRPRAGAARSRRRRWPPA